MLPLRREEKEGCVRREKEGLKEELRETRVLVRGTLHECGGRWDRAKGVDEPSQLFAQNTAVDDNGKSATRKCGL